MQKTDFNRDWTVQKDGSTEILHVNLPDDAMIREERSKANVLTDTQTFLLTSLEKSLPEQMN